MVVLHQFAHHQEVDGQAVFAVVVVVEAGVTVFMTTPVYDRAVYRAHKEVYRQQQEHPPGSGEGYVKGNITQHKQDAHGPHIADLIHGLPFGIIALESLFWLYVILGVVEVNIFGMHSHMPYIFKKMRGVRVLLGIAVGMVHPVHDSIGARVQERRALCDKGEHIKEPFPEFAHRKHFMGAVTMQEERLAEKR